MESHEPSCHGPTNVRRSVASNRGCRRKVLDMALLDDLVMHLVFILLGMDHPRWCRGVAGGNPGNPENPESRDTCINMPISTHSSVTNLLHSSAHRSAPTQTPTKLQDGSTWSAVGTSKHVLETPKAYKPEVSVTEDMLLFVLAMSPSVFENVIQGLSGNLLNAQKTLYDSTQYGHPQNVSTRVEVTHWFGTAVQYTLDMAGIYTSGTDNDWGLGITKLSDQCWFCDKTLRTDPRFVSVYIRDLLLIVFSPVIIELISGFLNFLIMRNYKKNPESRIGQANVIKEFAYFHAVAPSVA